jgi:hypothetical protein
MTKKPKERTVESIIDYLPPRNYSDNYPDRSVEYAVAYALNKAGIKTLHFGSCGPPGKKKAQFNSFTIKCSKKIGDDIFLYALLRLFKIPFSGGANSTHQQASWGKHDEISKNPYANYTSFYFRTDDCRDFAPMVNAYLTWLNQKYE